MLSKNKTIAKNSLFLYFRMFLIMLVSLYTVRVVIQTLGVTDYGIYSAVGGIVLIMSFVSQTITSAAQRFFSYELGTEDYERLSKTFSSILIVFFVIGILIIILAETIGLWFMYNKMVIPLERMEAAFWTFQFSLLTFFVTIMSTPYNALIIAHEDMKFFAYVSIIEAVLKLLIVYLLLAFSFDRLILYSILTFLVTCLIRIIYGIICSKHYAETKFTFNLDKDILRSIFSYSSWTMFGTLASAANNQGVAILLNMFFGPVANAAQSVARQVGNALQLFSGNFLTAIRPPLIKSYAEHNFTYMMQLFYNSSKYTFFLLCIPVLPLMVKADVILLIWLGEVGDYMVVFTQLTIAYVLLIALGTPITIVLQAANKVKIYHGFVDGFALISLPISYFLYKCSFPASTALWVILCVFILAHVIRLVILHHFIKYQYRDYLFRIVLPMLSVVVITLGLFYVFDFYVTLGSAIVNLVVDSSFLVVVSVLSIYLVGISKEERLKLKKIILRR